MNWIKVEPNPADNKPENLPPLDKVVWVIYLSDFDDGQVIALGGRIDDGDGWLWAVEECNRYEGSGNWSNLIADDEYRVVYWAEIEWPDTVKT